MYKNISEFTVIDKETIVFNDGFNKNQDNKKIFFTTKVHSGTDKFLNSFGV